jgi:hypothetical protein
MPEIFPIYRFIRKSLTVTSYPHPAHKYPSTASTAPDATLSAPPMLPPALPPTLQCDRISDAGNGMAIAVEGEPVRVLGVMGDRWPYLL